MRYFLFVLVILNVNLLSAQNNLSQKIVKWRVDKITKYATPSYWERNERKLFGIPMLHVNKPEFYENVKQTVDSLRNEGYVVFYEGIDLELETKEETDLYMKKFRSITHETLMNYYDENNEVNQSFQIDNYTYQKEADYGLDVTKDVHCDMNIKELVLKYEEKFGVINLTDCDWKTPLGKKYTCSKKNRKGYDYMISTLRNEHLFQQIENSKADKIAVIYGKAHIDVLHLMLKRTGWKYTHL